MDYAKESLRLHKEWGGKIEVICKVPCKTKDDLSLAYTPGVAQPCLEIQKDISKSYELTRRHNLCAVITDGTAVLGLGDIGPEAGMPVMEGKCALFKAFADVDAFPLCVKTHDVDEFVNAVLHGQRLHFFAGSLERRQPGAEGEGRTGQHTACVGLDIHLPPGHLPEGLPLPLPDHIFAFQQIAQQKRLGGQRRQRPAVQRPDGIVQMGNGKGSAQKTYGKFLSVPADVRQPRRHGGGVQIAEQLRVMGKGGFFFVVFYLHIPYSLIV